MRVPPELLEPLRGSPGRALMLGHVHPDADVLGTLLALGLALADRIEPGQDHAPLDALVTELEARLAQATEIGRVGAY